MNAWLSNTYLTYGNRLSDFDLCDTRTINHDQRFFLTNNALDPKVYVTTKVVELSPQGIIKLSLKQDEVDLDKDNLDLFICDYYSDTGDVQIELPQVDESEPNEVTYHISRTTLSPDGEAAEYEGDDAHILHLTEPAFFQIVADEGEVPQTFDWRLSMSEDVDKETATQLINRIQLDTLDDVTVCVRTGRSHLLLNQKFILTVTDRTGVYPSVSYELEVAENAT